MSVEPLFAQWLQREADWCVRGNQAFVDRWAGSAAVAERVTAIATRAAAAAEGDRQLAFFARGPFAIDVHQVTGSGWEVALGSVVRLSIDQLGYDDGLDVFVLEVECDRATGTTSLAALRPL